MVAPSKFAHIVYATHHFDEMVEWYIKVFEARIQHASGPLAFLTYDDEHHRFAILDLGPAKDEATSRRTGAVGAHHVAYTWDDLDGLMGTYERLRDLDIRPLVRLRHGMTLSMYYEDPDGNRSEFQIDLLDPDAANAFMAGEAFAANPIGEDFDADRLLAAFRAGDDVSELVWRSDQDIVPIVAVP